MELVLNVDFIGFLNVLYTLGAAKTGRPEGEAGGEREPRGKAVGHREEDAVSTLE